MLNNLIQKSSKDIYVLSLLMSFPILTVSKLPLLLYALILYVLVLKRKIFAYNFTKSNIKLLLIISLWVVFSFITFFYSENLNRYSITIIRILPFIFFPFFILFGFKTISKNDLSILFKVLIFFMLIKIFIVYLGIVEGSNHFYNEKISAFNLIDNAKRFLIHTPNQLIGNYKWQPNRPIMYFHKAYFSILLLVCITYLLYKIIISNRKAYKLIGIIILLVFNAVLLFLFSFPNIILLFIIYCFFIFREFKKSSKLLIIMVSSVILLTTFYCLSPGGNNYINIQQKKLSIYIKSFEKQIQNPNSIVINNARIRSANCALENINKNLIFGYGEGDVNEVLLGCYNQKKFLTQLKERHNTHNYYLDRLLSGGLIMLTLFLLMFLTLFRMAIKNKDILSFIILFIFAFNLFFENVFSVAYGVFMFNILSTICLKFNMGFKKNKNS